MFKTNITLFTSVLMCLGIFQYQGTSQELPKVVLQQVDSLKEGQPEKAANVLFHSIEEEQNEAEKGKLLAKYRTTFLRLTKDASKRKTYLEKKIEIFENQNPLDTTGLINSYFEYASDLKDFARNPTSALLYMDKAIDTWNTYYSQPDESYAQLLLTKIAILSNLGAGEDVLDDYEEVFSIYDGLTEPYDENMLSSLQIGFAKNLIRYGFHTRSQYYLERVEHIYEKNAVYFRTAEKQTKNEYAYPLDLISTEAKLYSHKGDEAKLLATLKKADTYVLGKELSKRAQYYHANCYNEAGLYYLDNDQPQKALAHLESAVALMPENAFTVYRNYFLLNAAKAKKSIGDHDKALSIFAMLEPQLPRQLQGFLYVSRAGIWAAKNQPEKLLKDANAAIASFSQGPLQHILTDSKIVEEYTPSTRLNDAIKLAELAQALVNSDENGNTDITVSANHAFKIALLQFKNSYRKQLYTEKLEIIFDGIISGILASGEPGDNQLALESLVNFKSKFLWHNFLRNRKSEAFTIPDSLLRLENKLSTTVLNLRLSDSLEQSKSISDALTKNQERLANVQNIIENRYNSFRYFEKYGFNLEDFKNGLSADQTICQYVQLNEQLYMFLFSNHGMQMVDLGNYKAIEIQVTEYLKLLSNPTSKVNTLKAKGEQLYIALGISNTDNTKSLTIIPDKVLNYLPFETLVHNGTYLVQQTPINYASSIPFLSFQRSSKTSNGAMAVVFTPSYREVNAAEQQLALRNDFQTLKGALQEGMEVTHLTRGISFSGKEASKSNFLENISEKKIIHLAMHAFLNNEVPEFSSLVFDDGPLYLSELYALKLKADLVVLSACDTGLGKFETGKGVVSLNNAFLYAGVPNTISTIWSVPDENSKNIMVSFYKQLSAGQNTAEALQTAKKTYLNTTSNPKLKHPFYWAGFIHHGQATHIAFPNRWNYLWFGLIVIIGAVLAFLFIRRSKTKTE
ncbi:MAG: CHAT domain-containing protein [Bacteroidota bacterium]